jgi:NosR/NirI family nitrous oxide reductase transcriptional regulator
LKTVKPLGQFVLALLCLLLWGTAARAESFSEHYPQVRSFFPQSDRVGEPEGEPPAASVYRGNMLLGYAYLTTDVVQIPAYSGRPITTLVGFDLAGRITGIEVVHHEEPILAVGISNERLQQFARQYVGKSVFDRIIIGGTREGYVTIDAISGATITMMVENASIMQSVRKVAEARGLKPSAAAAAAPTPPVGAAPDKIAPAGERRRWLPARNRSGCRCGASACSRSACCSPVWCFSR